MERSVSQLPVSKTQSSEQKQAHLHRPTLLKEVIETVPRTDLPYQIPSGTFGPPFPTSLFFPLSYNFSYFPPLVFHRLSISIVKEVDKEVE